MAFKKSYGSKPRYKRKAYKGRKGKGGMGMRGKGLYMGGSGGYNLAKHIGASLGHRLGIGRRMGSSIGGSVGKIARTAVASLSGKGLYSHNSLIKGGGAEYEGVPSFATAKDETGSLTICHREYLTDVFGNEKKPDDETASIPFQNVSYALNPGLETTFPWLSQIASNYEEYEIKQLVFTYKSIIADIGSSTNGQVGTAIMATNYNAAKPSFTDKQEMMEYAHASSTKVTASMLHGVECDPKKLGGSKTRYVRTAPVATGEDIKTYDHGKFQIAFANTPVAYANQTLGELWVSYTVKLSKPKFSVARGMNIQRALFYNSKTLDNSFGKATLFTPYYLRAQQNNFGGMKLVRVGTENRLVFPASYAGFCRFYVNMQGAGVDSPILMTSSGNIQFCSNLYSGASGSPDPAKGQGIYNTTNASVTMDMTIAQASNGKDNYVVIPPPATCTTITSMYIDIAELNPAMKQSELLESPAWLNYQGSLTAIPPLNE